MCVRNDHHAKDENDPSMMYSTTIVGLLLKFCVGECIGCGRGAGHSEHSQIPSNHTIGCV